MAKRTSGTGSERSPSYILPRWEFRRHRLRLDRRVRAVRRWLLAGGAIGTVAFSALAGYETKVASGADSSPQTVAPASVTHVTGSGFFADQASPRLAAASPTASATATATVTPTETATPATTIPATTTSATATATATVTPTATIVPTAAPPPIAADPSAPANDAPPQTQSRTHSSN